MSGFILLIIVKCLLSFNQNIWTIEVLLLYKKQQNGLFPQAMLKKPFPQMCDLIIKVK